MQATLDPSSPDLYPGGNPGADLIGKRVTFKLLHSDQANTFNTARHDEDQVGVAKVAYDGYLVVIVAGWRYGHTVPHQHVSLAAVDIHCGDCGLPVVETPECRDMRHDHCGPLPHTGPVGGPYCDQCA